MDFIKKQGIASYIFLVVIVMAIVSLAIYSGNSANPYFGKNALNGAIVTMTVFAIIFSLVAIVLPQFFSESKIVKAVADVCMILVPVMLAFSLMLFVGDRVYEFAIVYGSDLEKGNQLALDAVGQAVVGIVIYGITLLISLVAAFFSIRRTVK